jgi:hypothetical protein
MDSNKIDTYYCNICNKKYSSYKSLWLHNKKYHNVKQSNSTKNTQISIISPSISTQNKNTCKYCNKILSRSDSLKRHEEKCSTKIVTTIIDATKQKELELEIKKEESNILKLKIKLEKTKRIDTKTFKSLNKMLMDHSFKMKNSNYNSNNTSNVQNNTFNLVGFGNENIVEALSNKDKKQILNSGYCCLEKIIELSNCAEKDQFKNLIITNLKDNYAYKYDDKLGYFITTSKADALKDLIYDRVNDIEVIFNEISNSSKIDDKMKSIIQKFLDKIHDDELKFKDENENKTFDNYFEYKKDKIIILLYNNQDKITKDITLLFAKSNFDLVPNISLTNTTY